ncbi:chemotaxis protein CheD [bacterium]|nr:chemotaxis protein CheD [bacterium]
METFLKMSEIHVARAPDIIKTVVGSCIALCIWDQETKIGGMAHIMLPERNGDIGAPPGKYADIAVQALIDQMKGKGAAEKHMIATCIGGAAMFATLTGQKMTIGDRNADIVKQYLEKYRIPIMIESVGGFAGRKVSLNCSDGAVTVTMLNKKMQLFQ